MREGSVYPFVTNNRIVVIGGTTEKKDFSKFCIEKLDVRCERRRGSESWQAFERGVPWSSKSTAIDSRGGSLEIILFTTKYISGRDELPAELEMEHLRK